MQYKTIFRILGALLMLFSLSMIPPIIVALIYGDGTIDSFVAAFLITFFVGLCLWLPFYKKSSELKTRDGFLVAVLFWVVLCFFGALPLLFATDPVMSFTNAMFESVSGLTTTGATVLTGIDFLPHSLLYYRQQLQFLGGMGIIVLAVAIMPMLGIGGMQLYRAEIPGPIKESKLTPRITETAKTLWLIYIGLTILCALCYWIAGMTFFDALGESFTTVATGGFTMHDNSFAYYHNPGIEIIAIVFMLLGATNFSLHFLVLNNKKFSAYWKDIEFKFFRYILLVVTIITTLTLLRYNIFDNVKTTLLKASFDTVSMLTTTGFITGNFSTWPSFIPFFIMIFAMVGGCGGSTSGGIKVMRVLLVLKQGFLELQRLIHPRSVLSLKFGKQILPPYVIGGVSGYIAIFIFIFIILFLVMLAAGMDVTTAFGAVTATLANTGASIGGVAHSYQALSDLEKWILIFAMLLGRLEIFSILILFTPGFWRR
ncbi:MAG: TrkH family potassium uptake protein [Pseudomonadota bacterium]